MRVREVHIISVVLDRNHKGDSKPIMLACNKNSNVSGESHTHMSQPSRADQKSDSK